MSQLKSTQTKMRNGQKALIVFSLLLFAATPFIFIYSQKLFYWMECGNKISKRYVGWSLCGGLGIGYVLDAIALVLVVLIASVLLMLYATRARNPK